MEKLILKELLAKEQVVAPCIWDCMSAKAAELSGYKALMLSSTCLANSMLGMPDFGLMNVEEVIYAVERIARTSPLPVILDGEDGYGDSPLLVYRNVQRLAKAGAQAITIDDSTSARGWERFLYGESPLNTYRMTTRLIKAGAAGMTLDDSTGIRGYERVIVGGAHPIMDEEIWLAKIRAAKAAIDAQESDFLLIARTIVLRKQGIDAAIERCQRAMAAGADMTLVIGLNNLEDCKRIAAEVPGWKMYPDIATTNGKADVDVKDIVPLGFNLITMHYTEYGAMWGMMYYGMENFKNENTVFSDVHAMGGLTMKDRLDQLAMDYREWLRLEKACYEGKEDEKK